MKATGQAAWVFGLISAAMPVLAHHSFKAEFDENRQVTLSGTIAKVTWKNPHVRMFVDVKDDGGRITNWELELASPNGLLSQGWKVDSLKPGDQVTVNGFPARDAAKNLLQARKVTLGVPGQGASALRH